MTADVVKQPTFDDEPEPLGCSAAQLESSFRSTRKMPPSYSIRSKPKIIVGATDPNWTKQIPGPGTYAYSTDMFMKRAPAWGTPTADPRGTLKRPSSTPAKTFPKIASDEMLEKGYKASTPTPPSFSMRVKPEMVIGGTVPSWTNSIPGPKYLYDTNKFKKSQPVFTLGAKLETGGNDPSTWTKSIPGPKYSYSTDMFKARQPVYTIGEKLPTEGELMSQRSPGPIYKGPVADATAQSLVDGSKKKSPSPGFGIGSRFEGKSAAMVRSGMTGRFEHGKHCFG